MEKLSQILHEQAKKQGDLMIRRGRTQGNNSDDKFRAPTFSLNSTDQEFAQANRHRASQFV